MFLLSKAKPTREDSGNGNSGRMGDHSGHSSRKGGAFCAKPNNKRGENARCLFFAHK